MVCQERRAMARFQRDTDVRGLLMAFSATEKFKPTLATFEPSIGLIVTQLHKSIDVYFNRTTRHLSSWSIIPATPVRRLT